jgi:protease II
MWFYSLPVFDERGRAFTDLYLAHYRDQSININPITRLNIHELGLQDRQTTKYIFISAETYHPPEHRIYLSLREAEINPGGFEFLYSTDFEGNLRFEADIAALDLHSQLPTVIRQIFSNPSDDTLYLVTYTEGIGENHLIGRISVLRLNRDKTLEHLYVYNFDRFDETISRFITSSKLSPDGQYLAIGLSTSAHIGTGRLIVIDLMRGDVVTEQAISRQVCQVFWSDDSFQVIYTQTDQRACVRYFENLPVNRLVAYDVLTDTSQVLIEDATLPFYFLANQ